MRDRLSELRSQWFECVFFLFVTACVLAEADFCRYLIFGIKTVVATQCISLVGAYIAIWIITGIFGGSPEVNPLQS